MSDNPLRALYQDLILDHGKHPRNFRALPHANRKVQGHNPLCGDKITLTLSVNENGIVEDAAFQGSGCAISMASASMMTEMLKGKTVDEARALGIHFHGLCTSTAVPAPETGNALGDSAKTRLEALSGVRHYPVRVKCAMLAWRALEAALDEPETITIKTE